MSNPNIAGMQIVVLFVMCECDEYYCCPYNVMVRIQCAIYLVQLCNGYTHMHIRYIIPRVNNKTLVV